MYCLSVLNLVHGSSRVSSFVLCSEAIILFCEEILKEDLAYLVIPCRCAAKL